MRFIVRITDYHFGGHIFYIKLIEQGGYKLEPDRTQATVFNSIHDFVGIRDNISNNAKREVKIEHIVDNEFLGEMERL